MTDTFNERNLIKVRQICFLYMFVIPLNKLIALPSFLAESVEESAPFSLLMSLAIDVLLLWLILYIGEKKRFKTTYSLMEKSYGIITAKALYCLFAIYFLIKAFFPILEQKVYVENTLYEIMPNDITFYPFFLVSIFVSLGGLKILGRFADVSIWFTLTGIILVFFLSIGSVDLSNMLPLFNKPFYKLINATFRSLMWHMDSLYMIMMLGHFRPEENYKKKIVLSYSASSLVVFIFAIFFIGVFGPISASQDFALAQMCVFSVTVTNIGRFDYIAVFILLFVQIITIILPVFFSTKCLERTLGTKKALIPCLIVNGLLAIGIMLFASTPFSVLIFTREYLSYFYLGMLILMPLCLLFTKKEQPQ